MTIGEGLAHNEFLFSRDYALIQLCTPATYDTVPVDGPEAC
jgi:hypothetical protein